MARLAAFDMDGTLLMPNHHLGDETLSTLSRLRERDITLTFATGRHVLEMRHILGSISLDAFLITGNGTRIHSVEGDVLHRQDLDPNVADIVLHQKWDTTASMHVFNDNGWFTGQEIPSLLQAHVYSGFRYQIVDVKRIPAHQVTKVCFCGDHDSLIQLRIQLNEALGEQAVNFRHHAAQFGAIKVALHQIDHVLHQQIALHLHDRCGCWADEEH